MWEQPEGELILIVEDDADNRDTLAQLLLIKGYRVKCVSNGRQALDFLDRGTRPCIILLDLLMPDMNGWQFRDLLVVDPSLASIPIVVITGVQKAALVDAVGHFTKPLPIDALMDVVKEHCGEPEPACSR